MAEEPNMNVTTCALHGGEDYELLGTVPLTEHERVSAIEGIKVIGHITKPELGCALILSLIHIWFRNDKTPLQATAE